MIVKKIKWLSTQASEAEISISDGNYECVVFSQPCNFEVNDEIETPLRAFITEGLMTSYQNDYLVQPMAPGSLSHKCIAKVVDVEKSLVKIGEIFIVLDEKIPPGCLKETFVEFSCVRLDV